MKLTSEQQAMLAGKDGRSTQKAMEILVALGTIYGAERMIPVQSVQVAGVSYDNLGEAGLEFLAEMASGGGIVKVLTTLNPAGMDIENWQALGIDEAFAANQLRVIEAFAQMGIVTTCSCTPYLFGNLPHFGEHIAWAESSAVCFANSVLGARTNREGGPSALAAALTGFTPEYGYHLSQNREPDLTVHVSARLDGPHHFGALGKAVGEYIQAYGKKCVPFFQGIPNASLESLKSLCASLATFGGSALFHMENITPEASGVRPPGNVLEVRDEDLEKAARLLGGGQWDEVDFVSLGCPHLTLPEIAHLARLLKGKRVNTEFWITTSRPVKQIADQMGYSRVIEASGAKFAADTCCVVAPLKGRFHTIATDSAKACYYAVSKNQMKTIFLPFEDIVRLSLGELEERQ